jgi:peptidyl-tRNA hydrolase, PTH1 family
MNAIRSFLSQRGSPARAAEAVGSLEKMVVGLGNPGPEHARDRHNIGFQVVDVFAARHGLEFDRFQKRARLGIGQVSLSSGWRGRVLLAKPMTYMNVSGEAVSALAAFYKIAPASILVVHDDLDLPLGRIRMRPGGSPGGQKGVASIIKTLGTESFHRLRVGISRPGGQASYVPPAMEPADYVLRPFAVEQEKEMEFVRPRAAEAIEVWLSQGIDAAMNLYNGGG